MKIKNIEEMKTELLKSRYRNYMLFVLGINTGLRISGLLELKVKDVKDKIYIILVEQKQIKIRKFLLTIC